MTISGGFNVENAQVTQLPSSVLSTEVGGAPGEGQTAVAEELRATRTIVEDLQRRTFELTYRVPGSPDEAYHDASLGGYEIGKPFPRADLLPSQLRTIFSDMFVVRRTFTKLNDNSIRTQRWTEVKIQFQKRTCPFSYEETFDTVLVPTPVWWDSDFKRGEGRPDLPQGAQALDSVNPVSVPYPQYILQRRWPLVELYEAQVVELSENVGVVSTKTFYHQKENVWLLEKVQIQKLWGPPGGTTSALSTWDITLVWRGDPYRFHEQWIAPKTVETTKKLIQPTSFEELPNVHHRRRVFEYTDIEWDDVSTGITQGVCALA